MDEHITIMEKRKPCVVKVMVGGGSYTVSGNAKVRLKINQSTGAFEKVEVYDGTNFNEVISNISAFGGGENKIVVSNTNNGKSASVKFNLHVGTVNVSY